MRCALTGGAHVVACSCVDDRVLGRSAAELFCEVGTPSHVLGRFCLHPRKTPFCCSPSPLTAPRPLPGLVGGPQRPHKGASRTRCGRELLRTRAGWRRTASHLCFPTSSPLPSFTSFHTSLLSVRTAQFGSLPQPGARRVLSHSGLLQNLGEAVHLE